jgi:biopolymer transport protein ExbB
MFEKTTGIWLSGGWVMIPLALLAVLIHSSGIQLLLFLRKGNIQLGHESEWMSWIYDPSKAQGRAGEIIRYTQENISESKHARNRFEEVRQSMLHNIEQRMIFLNTLVAAAPLMGLLGTVIGMLGTVAAISSGGGAETAAMVAAGISEALITTQTGRFIALPGIFLVLIIRRRKHAIEAALARIEALSLTVSFSTLNAQSDPTKNMWNDPATRTADQGQDQRRTQTRRQQRYPLTHSRRQDPHPQRQLRRRQSHDRTDPSATRHTDQ